MEDFLSIIMVFFVLIGAFKKVAKAPQKAQRPAARPFSVELDDDDQPAIPYAPAAAQPAAAPMRAEPQTMLPLQPVQRPHAAEGESQPPSFAERMRSMEGRDPCHEQQLQPAIRPASAPILQPTEEEVQPAITLDFTRDVLLRAVVMQEVLTRPCERRNRRIG